MHLTCLESYLQPVENRTWVHWSSHLGLGFQSLCPSLLQDVYRLSLVDNGLGFWCKSSVITVVRLQIT